MRIVICQGKKGPKANVKKESEYIKIPLGGEVVLGPHQIRTAIPPFTVKGVGVRSIIPIGQLSNILHTVTVRVDGRLRVLLYNCMINAQMLSHKLFIVGILYEKDVVLIVEEDNSLELEQGPSHEILT